MEKIEIKDFINSKYGKVLNWYRKEQQRPFHLRHRFVKQDLSYDVQYYLNNINFPSTYTELKQKNTFFKDFIHQDLINFLWYDKKLFMNWQIFYFYGDEGAGKTVQACWFLEQMVANFGYKGQYYSLKELGYDLNDITRTKKVFQSCFLVIDDIDKYHLDKKMQLNLYDTINEKIKNPYFHLVITGEAVPDALRTKIETKLARLITENKKSHSIFISTLHKSEDEYDKLGRKNDKYYHKHIPISEYLKREKEKEQ